MKERKTYLMVVSCVQVSFDEETGYYKLTECSSEDTRRCYNQAKSDGIIVGENHLQLSDGNKRPKQIIMTIARTEDKSMSADEVYKIKKNPGGKKKKKVLPAAKSVGIVAVPA